MINCFIAVSKRNNLDHGDDIGLGAYISDTDPALGTQVVVHRFM